MALWAGLVLLVASGWLKDASPLTMCQFKRISGVPCVTCGGTRAGTAILGGDPLAALRFNPLLVIAAGLIGGCLAVRFAVARKPVLEMDRQGRLLLLAALLLVIGANWAYLIAAGI